MRIYFKFVINSTIKYSSWIQMDHNLKIVNLYTKGFFMLKKKIGNPKGFPVC